MAYNILDKILYAMKIAISNFDLELRSKANKCSCAI